ncbi:MAG: type II toxin-antitoxin system VapC family toxin [Paludibacteraceae bacterium]
MKKYLLDTHIIIWFISGNSELSNTIVDEIRYFQNIYYVSVVSLQEFVMLVKNNKIKTKKTLTELVSDLRKYNINILDLKPEHVQCYETLSSPLFHGKKHDDPFDRILIAQSISERMTIISADTRFPLYKDKNFKLRGNT